MEKAAPMPELTGLLETALYVEDVARARPFYRDVLGLESLSESDDGTVFAVAGQQVLLVLGEAKARIPSVLPDGQTVPVVLDRSGPARGAGHVAFAITAAELDGWRRRLAEHGVAIEGQISWDRGGHSLYFRDPDGHLLELATPGVWEVY